MIFSHAKRTKNWLLQQSCLNPNVPTYNRKLSAKNQLELSIPVFALIFFTYLPESQIYKKISIYSNRFFHNFHLSESSFTCGLARRLTFLSAPSVFSSLLFGSWHCLVRHWCGRERRKNQAQQSSSHEASAFIYKIKLQQQLWKQKLL